MNQETRNEPIFVHSNDENKPQKTNGSHDYIED